MGPGSLIGCDVLHGEPYHHTGIWVSAEARLFSVSAAIFLEKLVGADVPLDRPPTTPDVCDGESVRLRRGCEAGWPVAPAVEAFFAASKHADRTSADMADLKVMHAHLFPLNDWPRSTAFCRETLFGMSTFEEFEEGGVLGDDRGKLNKDLQAKKDKRTR